MKQFKDYKKYYKYCGFALLVALLVLPAFSSRAQTAAELTSRINEKNAEIAKLEREIRAFQQEIDKLGKEKTSLSNSIKQLDVSRRKLIADISVTENKIDKTNFRIQELSLEIGDKEGIIRNNMNAIAAEIRRAHELDMANPIVTMLSDKTFTEIWTDIDNMMSVREAIINRTEELRGVKVVLEDTRDVTTQAKNELVALRSQLSDQKKVVDDNTSEKKKLLSQTQNSEASYQRLLKDQEAKKALFEKEIFDYQSQLKYILDPKTLPGPGVLSWPLDHVYVTQQFGAKTGPHRTYVSGHSGTDFRARTPVRAMAMADGIVKGVGDTDLACPGASFGRWVYIEYNNGLGSTYGHLSTITAREGQAVKRGDVVGYTGGTGRVTGPHLHVSLYAANAVKLDAVPSKACPGKILKQPIAATSAYLDPMYYLPPYTQ
ncbi:MAG TPA: peptidoglycan DD-metalloendopeptidase family protein [Candidatus Paceibacterota bacterium]|nr:peptidoglycan DD-metalloendopeptidase family protein [Candidatus Paceibacterota bacterium]